MSLWFNLCIDLFDVFWDIVKKQNIWIRWQILIQFSPETNKHAVVDITYSFLILSLLIYWFEDEKIGRVLVLPGKLIILNFTTLVSSLIATCLLKSITYIRYTCWLKLSAWFVVLSSQKKQSKSTFITVRIPEHIAIHRKGKMRC